MKIIPIKAENGVLDMFFFEGNKSFSFLEEEPELYNDNDILKNRKNEKFLQ